MTAAAENGNGGLIVHGDYACPFCYLAEAPLARLRAEGVAVKRRAFELRPAPLPLPDLRSADFRTVWERAVLPLAERLGVAIGVPVRSTRTRKAHEACAHARSCGMLEEMHAAVFRAYFVDGRDIGRIDVLVEIGTELAMDQAELRVALDTDRWTERVAAEAEAAIALDVRAVPAFRRQPADGESNGGTIVGVRDYETLRRFALGVPYSENSL